MKHNYTDPVMIKRSAACRKGLLRYREHWKWMTRMGGFNPRYIKQFATEQKGRAVPLYLDELEHVVKVMRDLEQDYPTLVAQKKSRS